MTVVAFKNKEDPKAHTYDNGLEKQFSFPYSGFSGKIKEEFALTRTALIESARQLETL
jgi:hypothetical protein